MRRTRINSAAPFGACLLAKPRKRPMAKYKRDEAPFAAAVELDRKTIVLQIAVAVLSGDDRVA